MNERIDVGIGISIGFGIDQYWYRMVSVSIGTGIERYRYRSVPVLALVSV